MVQMRVPTLGVGDKLGSKWLNWNVVNVRDYGTVGNGVADDTAKINAAIAAVPASGGVLYFPTGKYKVTSPILVTRGSIIIAGEGMGATTIMAGETMTGATPLLDVASTAAFGADQTLTVEPAPGSMTITVSAAASATYAVGDWILIKSNMLSDLESTTKKVGELHWITAINTTTGVITLNDVVIGTYTLADVAKIAKIPMIADVTVRDLSFTSLATSSTLSGGGFTRFRYIENLAISGVEQHHAYHSMELRSCFNGRVENSYFHHISDVTPSANLRYGIWVASASQNIVINSCRFTQTRHSVTTGGVSGVNLEGIQRNIVISNCTSTQSDTAHFDAHDPCDGISFIGNTIIGGMPFSGGADAVVGIQVRCRNAVIANNIIRGVPGRGIMVFNANAHGATIIGNNISNITRAFGATTGEGIGIHFDSAGTSRHLISGNTIKDCAGRAIGGVGGQNDTVVIGNSIDNCPTSGSGVSIYFNNALRVQIIGNRVSNNTAGRWLQSAGTSDDWLITGNSVFNATVSNAPALVGLTNVLNNNNGVNPLAPIALTVSTGAVTINRANGHFHYVTLTGPLTPTISAGLQIGDELMLMFTQDATGGRTITWPTNVKRTGGALVLSTAAGVTDLITLVWSPGAVWREKSRAMNLPA